MSFANVQLKSQVTEIKDYLTNEIFIKCRLRFYIDRSICINYSKKDGYFYCIIPVITDIVIRNNGDDLNINDVDTSIMEISI